MVILCHCGPSVHAQFQCHMHTPFPDPAQMCTRMRMHTQTHTHACTYTHRENIPCTQSRESILRQQVYMPALHMHMHACTPTRTHARPHARTHTHTHTHKHVSFLKTHTVIDLVLFHDQVVSRKGSLVNEYSAQCVEEMQLTVKLLVQG